MAKKYSYHAELRQQMGNLIEQLELPDLHKQSLKDRWLDQMIWADKKAGETRKWHYRLRLTTIVGGVLLPALVGVSVQMKDNRDLQLWFPYLAFGLSQVIAVSAALDEFCRFGDGWRNYRKMAEDLKAEGWQYLQSSGPYAFKEEILEAMPIEELRSADPYESTSNRFSEQLRELRSNGTTNGNGAAKHSLVPTSHLQSYAEFAGRIEAIIRDDVKSYVSDLEKRQAKQEAQVEKILTQAQSVATDKNLLNQLNPNYHQNQIPPGYPGAPGQPPYPNAPGYPPAPGYAAPGYPGYPPQPGYPPAPGYPPQPGYPAQPGYPPAPGYSPQPGYAVAPGMPAAAFDSNGAVMNALLGSGTASLGGFTASTPAAPAMPAAPAAPVVSPNGDIRLPVPYFSQRDNLEDPYRVCNTYSCSMVGKFLGAQISSAEEYYHIVIQHGDTTDHDVQTKALTQVGIQSSWQTTLDFADLDQSLAKGMPVVIGILHHGPLEAPSGGGHMVVVTGRTANGDYLVNDPYGNLLDEYATHAGGSLIYPRHVLERRWLVEGPKSGWGRIFQGNHSPAPIAPITNGHAAPAAAPATAAAVPQRITAEQLIQIAGPGAPVDRLRQFTPAVNETFEKFKINTPLRIAHFLAQIMHESGAFQYVREIWDGTGYQAEYEGREDLGNNQPGDGKRFMGRGLVQLTGRANYTEFAHAIGVDCVSNPELVEQAPYAVLVAGWYWDSRNLNGPADRDDLEAVTRLVNGGTLGIAERAEFLQAAKSVLKC